LIAQTKLLSVSVIAAVQIRQSKGLFATSIRFIFTETKTGYMK